MAVAVLEAKSDDKPATYGLDQAKTYQRTAKRLNVPFVIATNGPWASKTPIHLESSRTMSRHRGGRKPRVCWVAHAESGWAVEGLRWIHRLPSSMQRRT